MAYLLIYVDDIILTASSGDLLCSIVSSLIVDIYMKDLGSLHHFLGMSASWSTNGMSLSQRHYMLEILDCAGMTDSKHSSASIDTHAKLSADGPPSTDTTDYHALAGAL
jgi:hypothetical protein